MGTISGILGFGLGFYAQCYRHPSSSTSTPSSPTRVSSPEATRGTGPSHVAQAHLQRRLRHIDDLDVVLGVLDVDISYWSSSSPPQQRGLASTVQDIMVSVTILASKSASAREGAAPPRFASSSVLYLLPLSSPRPPESPGARTADGWYDCMTHMPRCGPIFPSLKKSPVFFFRPFSSN
jgi:hypothetical protein